MIIDPFDFKFYFSYLCRANNDKCAASFIGFIQLTQQMSRNRYLLRMGSDHKSEKLNGIQQMCMYVWFFFCFFF